MQMMRVGEQQIFSAFEQQNAYLNCTDMSGEIHARRGKSSLLNKSKNQSNMKLSDINDFAENSKPENNFAEGKEKNAEKTHAEATSQSGGCPIGNQRMVNTMLAVVVVMVCLVMLVVQKWDDLEDWRSALLSGSLFKRSREVFHKSLGANCT